MPHKYIKRIKYRSNPIIRPKLFSVQGNKKKEAFKEWKERPMTHQRRLISSLHPPSSRRTQARPGGIQNPLSKLLASRQVKPDNRSTIRQIPTSETQKPYPQRPAHLKRYRKRKRNPDPRRERGPNPK